MTATTGTDLNGPVEYFFDEISGNPGATDSGWRTSASYTDTGLDPSTQYTYTVQMRDSVTPTANVGAVSLPANATTYDAIAVYNFAGVTQATNDHFANAWEVDVFPCGGNTDNRNYNDEATDAQYTAIDVDDVNQWATRDPGSDDEMFLWVKMKIDQDVADITNIKLIFNGNSDGSTTEHRMYVMDYDQAWQDDTAWDQLGSGMVISADVDTEMSRNITSNFTDYIDPGGYIIWGVYQQDNSSDDLRINYIGMNVSYQVIDTDPPTPNPMTFATNPYASSTTSISMTATTATDPSNVEYYFTSAAGGGHDSVWQSSPVYTDSGLIPDVQYSYTVKARDQSVANNETAYSGAAMAMIDLYDGKNGMLDFAFFAQQWLSTNCGFCDGADLTDDQNVNIDDLLEFAENWLYVEP